MKAIAEITKVEFKLFTRNFISMFFVLAFPVMMLLMFGGIYGNKPSALFNGHGTIDVSVPAYTAMIIAVTGIMSLPLVICGYRERKILKRFKATLINPIHLIISQLVVNFAMTVVGMFLLIVVGKLVFDLRFLGNNLQMLLVFFLSVISIFSLGFLIASISPSMRAANGIANLVYFPMIFLTGATLPLEIMPDTMADISRFLPLTYAVNALKKTWLGGSLSDIKTDIIVLAAIFVLCFAISIKAFKWE